MNRHILIATDGSPNAKKAIQYAADLYADVADVDVTLLTVAEPLPALLTQGGTTFQGESKRLRRLEEIDRQRERECNDILERGKALLERSGFPAGRVHTKAVPKSSGVVSEILREARNGLYDALVVGRRGLGRLASYFIGSISGGVLQQVKNLPVWIVDEITRSKRVLVAVDACEECLKVVDHASFALAGIKDIQITIFHVIPKFRPFLASEDAASYTDVETALSSYSEERIKTLLSGVHELFGNAGFTKESVEVKIKHGSTGVARDILDRYQKGEYGTLVVGRRGIGGWEAIFPGSVSGKLLTNVPDGAVWVVS